MNRQNVIDYIRAEYDVDYEQLWMKYPDFFVFRNRQNKKWFALVADVEKAKLGLTGEGKVDVVNLKCDPLLLGSLRLNPGYLPAYHMNKKTWTTIVLDGSVGKDELLGLLSESRNSAGENGMHLRHPGVPEK